MPAAGPTYMLHCRDRHDAAVRLNYRPHASELTDESGAPLLLDAEPLDFAPAEAVSPHRPGRKSARVEVLKIQLGLRCNYGCSYCNQSSAVPEASITRTADADAFLTRLPHWLQGAPERIEFWGGEPLLYFAKLKRLVPALRQRFPSAVMSIVTNGSLVDGEVLGFIEAWDLHVAVSHDGPGQHLRGPDPFDDPVRAGWLRALWRRRGAGRASFHVVLTPANADLAATRGWFVRRLGDPEVAVDTEGVVGVYDDRSLQGAGRWREEDYRRLHAGLAAGFADGEALRWRSLREKARDFVQSLQQRRPAAALAQKCGMDRPEQLAVDLHGNVLTCQNTGAQGRHLLGHVARMDEVRLASATHWSHRASCSRCPVVQLCKGGCMFLEGAHFAQSCENEYRFHLAVLDGVLRRVTGLRLEGITGDIRRPGAHRTIPIAAVAA